MRDILNESILKAKQKKVYKEIPKFPAVKRDLSLVVSNDIKASQVDEVIRQFGNKLLKDFRLYDFYPMEGKKSFTYSIEYLNPEKTLTDEEVNKYQEELIKLLNKKINAELRK